MQRLFRGPGDWFETRNNFIISDIERDTDNSKLLSIITATVVGAIQQIADPS